MIVCLSVCFAQDAEGGCVDGDHDADEVDLTGLMESIVDSDEEEDLAESIDVRLPILLFCFPFLRFVFGFSFFFVNEKTIARLLTFSSFSRRFL